MKKIVISIISLFLVFSTQAQWLEYESVMPDSVTSWKAKDAVAYIGSYKFGDSEWESTLRIFVSEGTVWAQLQRGRWLQEGDKISWQLYYENFTKVRIEGDKFYSEQTNGKFVRFQVNAVPHVGLLVEDSWSDDIKDGAYEIGAGSNKISLPGEYSEASLKMLDKENLKDKTNEELAIMRNEIFARYGYIFKQGGKMEAYFKMQDWYRPIHPDVNSFLTEVELANIKLIREIEAQK